MPFLLLSLYTSEYHFQRNKSGYRCKTFIGAATEYGAFENIRDITTIIYYAAMSNVVLYECKVFGFDYRFDRTKPMSNFVVYMRRIFDCDKREVVEVEKKKRDEQLAEIKKILQAKQLAEMKRETNFSK